MVEQATAIPNPLLVDGMVPGTPGTRRLRLHPAFDGMHDTIAGIFPRWLMPWLDWLGWPVKPRKVPDGGPCTRPSTTGSSWPM